MEIVSGKDDGREGLAKEFADRLKARCEALKVDTKRKVFVTAGPYRSYDVEVEFGGDGIHIDFYSVIRIDGRIIPALDYAVRCIEQDKPL